MGTQDILVPLLKLFLLVIPGFLLSKKGIVSEYNSKSVSLIVVYVTWPCLIVDSLQVTFTRTKLLNAAYVSAALLAVLALSYLLSKIACRAIKIERSRTYLFSFMLLFSNTGFMGIPVTNALYGKEGVFYAVLIDALCNIFIYTAGILLIKKSTGTNGEATYKELLSPGMFGIVLGLILFATNTRLPAVLGDAVAMTGSATTTLAMLVLGFQLGKIRLKELTGDASIYLLAALKLILIPLVFFIFFSLTLPELSLFSKVLILEISMPVAVSTAIFTQQYDGDLAFTTKGVLLTTMISMITVPILAVIAN